MEARFGHDFGAVRVHADSRAHESARAVDALAYTVGPHVVFQAGRYEPESAAGQALLAHELTHVVQQGSSRPRTHPAPPFRSLADGGYRISVGPAVAGEPRHLEDEAAGMAERATTERAARAAPSTGDHHAPALQRVRVPLPTSVALCGRTLTHIDVEPPRARPLEPCLPPTVLVTRINIVGRDLSVPTVGRGPQVFNLHIGHFRDPATGRLCVIADDSKSCVTGRCVMLGCFLTMREVLDAIIDFVKKALVVIGIVALLILIALLIELLAPVLVPAAALAEGPPTSPASPNGDEAEDEGPGEEAVA